MHCFLVKLKANSGKGNSLFRPKIGRPGRSSYVLMIVVGVNKALGQSRQGRVSLLRIKVATIAMECNTTITMLMNVLHKRLHKTHTRFL